DRTLTDSSDILEYCNAAASPARRLYPEGEAARGEVRAIQTMCDTELGVASRLLAYYHGLPHGRRFTRVLRPSLSTMQAFALPIVFAFFAPKIRRLYGVTTESA